MRRVLVVVMLAGCVHNIGLAPIEQCATQSMALAGVSLETNESVAVATSGKFTAVGTETTYGQSVQCRPARSREETCQIRAAGASTRVKANWSPDGRNVLIFLGWSAFLIPGAITSVIFAGQQDAAQRDATEAFRVDYMDCMSDAP